MKKIDPKKIINNVEKAKFKYNNVTGTFRNELGQEKSAIEANNFNEKIEAQKARRRDYYSKLWDVQLDPKKMHKQDLKNNMRKWIRQADEERYKSFKSLKPKKPIPKVDLPSISKGISEYVALTKKEKPIPIPDLTKRRDPDMDKGLGSLPRKLL